MAAALPRVELLDAIATASENRDQVLELVSTAPTPEQARAALADQFNLSENGADAVLAMQLRRLTVTERKKITDERNELHQQIAASVTHRDAKCPRPVASQCN